MDAQRIKSAAHLTLKPNKHLRDITRPFKYQRRAALMMLVRPRMLLGDDVGLGKTYESIIAMTYILARDPTTKFLVFTEKACLSQWHDEIVDHTVDMKPRIITAETHPDPAKRIAALRLGEYDVLITTYNTAYDYSQYMLEGLGGRWCLFADEPNYFKNLETMLHWNVYGMVNGDIEGKTYRAEHYKDEQGQRRIQMINIPGSTCVRAYGMTATIIDNRLDEAFGMMRIITPGAFPDGKKGFEDKYCKMKTVRTGRKKITKVDGYKNLDHFRHRIEPFYYGRLQDDPEVEQDLPQVISKDLDIVLPDTQGRKLLEAMDKIFEMPTGEVKRLDVLPSLIVAQKMASDPRLGGFDMIGEKTEVLMEMLQNSLAGQRVFIYSKFRSAIDLLEAEIIRRNIERPVRITGSENQIQRDEARKRFMSDGPDRCNILLGTRASQKGLNLQKGGVLIFYDLPWSYGAYRQTIGRLKRTGSIHSHIVVIHLLGKLSPKLAMMAGAKTIDHYTLDTVRKKFQLWQAITGDIIEIQSVTEDVLDIFKAIREQQKLAA